MADTAPTRTVDGRTERLLLEMPGNPPVQDAALVMQTVAAAYPDLKLGAFVKDGPGDPLQVWVPVDADRAEVLFHNQAAYS